MVRPRLDTSGTSRASTHCCRARLHGADAGVEKETSEEFVGLEVPPIVTRDAAPAGSSICGRDIGSLDIGSPVYCRRIKVSGQIASYELDGDGRGVTLRVMSVALRQVRRREHALLAGQRHRCAAQRERLHAAHQSLATILLGGIAFQAPEDAMGPLATEATQSLCARAGRIHRDEEPDGPSQAMLMYFLQSVRGLSPGAPVDFRGIVIGEVKSIGVAVTTAPGAGS